jgi:hypothetical protein
MGPELATKLPTGENAPHQCGTAKIIPISNRNAQYSLINKEGSMALRIILTTAGGVGIAATMAVMAYSQIAFFTQSFTPSKDQNATEHSGTIAAPAATATPASNADVAAFVSATRAMATKQAQPSTHSPLTQQTEPSGANAVTVTVTGRGRYDLDPFTTLPAARPVTAHTQSAQLLEMSGYDQAPGVVPKSSGPPVTTAHKVLVPEAALPKEVPTLLLKKPPRRDEKIRPGVRWSTGEFR